MSTSIRETIETINGVQRCKLIEEAGEVMQVFVESTLAGQTEDARTQEIKAMVRSIIGAVTIRHNIELDYRKIKVIEYKAETEDVTEVHPRIQIVAAYQRRFPKPESVVELYGMKANYVGIVPLKEDIGVSIFEAFGEAFSKMGFGTVKLIYHQVLNNDLAQEKIVLIKLEYVQKDEDEVAILLGVAEVQEDLAISVVKAALNAVNRRMVITSTISA